MARKKVLLNIDAFVENVDEAKELLDDLEALSDKYEVTIGLRICQSPQESYAQI